MREYIFRGRDCFGEWHEGYLSERGESAIITPKSKCGVGYYVDRETVGQYIGLTDVNGKRIYEGDVLRLTQSGGDEEEITVEDYVVQFSEKKNCYEMQFVGFLENGFPDELIKQHEVELYHAEVVGNKWDNPELLGVQQ